MGIESVPEKMLACQVVEYNAPYKIHQVPTPRDLGPYDMLVKTAVASLCHTDGMVSAGVFKTKLPCTASHEGSGTIAAVGSSVTDFKEGDRVMCGLLRNQCGICADCLGPENYSQYCAHNDGAIGVNLDGAFADYVRIDSRTAAKLPDSVSFETAAPLACAGCTVWRGVLQADLKAKEWLAIVGSGGGLGHLGIQFAKALGLQVIGIDARDEGLQLSRTAGADVVIDARRGNEAVVAEVHKVTNGAGADATVNVSDAKSAAATACAVTKLHGVMVQIAQPDEVSIPFVELIFRDIRVHGSMICSPAEARRMLAVVAEHHISVKTNAFDGLHEIPKLVELAHGGKMQGKGIVVVDEGQRGVRKGEGRV
ncbi:hypothetical protein LTR04_000740 [Oleoguttula sp. CCFEE 6159]|nr:hypothetical protein LTR04_000740 [Oleoguttula sp. CCFEE 6159]